MFVFVNGYGAPRDIIGDANYGRYLKAVHASLANGDVLFLSGGATNREDVTEAGAMKEWFHTAFHECRGTRLATDVRIEMSSRDVQRTKQGLDEFARFIASEWARGDGHRSTGIRIFCEKSRVPVMAFLAGQYFEWPAWGVTIEGVPFDVDVVSPQSQLYHGSVTLLLEMFGWYAPPFDAFVNERLRARRQD